MRGLFKIFSGAKDLLGGSQKPAEASIAQTYEGMRVFPEPIQEGSVYRLCARIEMDVEGGDVKEHLVIRADTFNNRDEAVAASTAKAKQMIDEQGPRLFG